LQKHQIRIKQTGTLSFNLYRKQLGRGPMGRMGGRLFGKVADERKNRQVIGELSRKIRKTREELNA
jgi:hypothetical protein